MHSNSYAVLYGIPSSKKEVNKVTRKSAYLKKLIASINEWEELRQYLQTENVHVF